ncbi:hypothetical protein ACRN9C_03395 [Shewanella frigidimarina]|uniref:hypothetical protein n=1 Tax=Shewanella frigidimarina TaxID=56812 RepID=UPI003D7A16A8
MDIVCPSCHYLRKENSHPETPEWRCPACEIVYEKYEKNISKMNELSDVIAERQATEEAASPTKTPTPKPSHDTEPSKLAILISDYLGNFKVMFKDFLTAKGGLIILVVFILGFFTGREYFKYEIRQAVGSAFSGISNNLKPNKSDSSISKLFSKASDLPVSLVSIHYEEVNYIRGGKLNYVINFKNTLGKQIIGFNGELEFRDILDNYIEGIKVVFTEGANDGEIITLTDAEWVDNSLKNFKDGRVNQLKVKLLLTKVMYVDGSVDEFE